MNISSYLTPQFLFQINRLALEKIDKGFFVLGAVFIIFAIVLKMASLYAPTPVDAKYRQNFFVFFLSIGILLVIWFAARFENVMFFGSHFVAFLIVLVGLIWFVFILTSFIKHYGEEKREWMKEQVKLKYLPK